MSRCIQTYVQVRSAHSSKDFPLLSKQIELNGESYDLFSKGLVTARDIGPVISGLQHHIAEHYSGKHVLLVNVLEGGTHFYDVLRTKLEEYNKTAGDNKVEFDTDSVKAVSYRADQQSRVEVTRSLSTTDFSSYNAVIVLDDLLDTGNTMETILKEEIFPKIDSQKVEVNFLFEKDIERPETGEAFLNQYNKKNGILVPNKWIVGFGPNLTLPGKEPLHLFRDLPDLYAFNNSIMEELTTAYQTDPDDIRTQLEEFVTDV